jgi:hypothetical protein
MMLRMDISGISSIDHILADLGIDFDPEEFQKVIIDSQFYGTGYLRICFGKSSRRIYHIEDWKLRKDEEMY